MQRTPSSSRENNGGFLGLMGSRPPIYAGPNTITSTSFSVPPPTDFKSDYSVTDTSASSSRRKISFSSRSSKSPKTKQRDRTASSTTTTSNFSPEKRGTGAAVRPKTPRSVTAPERKESLSEQQAGHSSRQAALAAGKRLQSSSSATGLSTLNTSNPNMLATPFSRVDRPTTSHQQFTAGPMGPPFMGPSAINGPQSPTLEAITYQHIQEMASKRISTLDYLRKAYVLFDSYD